MYNVSLLDVNTSVAHLSPMWTNPYRSAVAIHGTPVQRDARETQRVSSETGVFSHDAVGIRDGELFNSMGSQN